MAEYKAKPEQWAHTENCAAEKLSCYSCILELRAKVESLEAAERQASKVYEINEPLQLTPEQAQHVRDLLAPNSKPTPNSSQIRSSLVERVQQAINTEYEESLGTGSMEARAAIREVAHWIDAEARQRQLYPHNGVYSAAEWLEQEAER
jgi:hypothetical protein